MNFFEKVYEAVRSIPDGKVASYGTIALLCGKPKASRQVGWALHVNPSPETIPCYKVVFKDGSLSKGFAFGGEGEQRRLLEAHGVEFDEYGKVKKEFFMTV